MNSELGVRIVKAREQNGLYTNLEDFTRRIDIGSSQLDILIRIDAFRCTGRSKYELIWEKNGVYNPAIKKNGTGLLFQESAKAQSLPILEKGPYDDYFDQLELLGFPLCSPFKLLDPATKVKEDITASQLEQFKGKAIRILGYYVTRKDVTTSNGKHMYFGCWVDKIGQVFDTVHFPGSAQKSTFSGKGIYLLVGKVVADFGFLTIEVTWMKRIPFRGDGRYG